MIPASDKKRSDYRRSGHWGDLTLGQMFNANVLAYPELEAVVDPSNRTDFTFGAPQRLTYQELSDEVARIAAGLIEHGIGKDDIVFVQLPNIHELLATYFACAEVGAIISPIPVVYREHELQSLRATAIPKAYIFAKYEGGADFHAIASKVFKDSTLMAFGEFDDSSLVNLSSYVPNGGMERDKEAIVIASADDIFTLCWTSGTTGVPKGVPRSHNHWSAIAPITRYSAQLQKHDILLNPFPMVNMGAIGGVVMSWLQTAGSIVLHQPFDLGVFMQQIREEQPHFTLAPPAILNMLLADENLAKSFESTSLRSIASGSAPLAPPMVKGFQDRFGIDIVNVFGSNEGMSLVSGPGNVADPVLRASYFPADARYPSLFEPASPDDATSHIQMRVVDVESRAVIKQYGQNGELEIKGPTVFEGYFNASDKTKEAFTQDGFFMTGDLFEYAHEQTQLKYVGRCKDLIIRGGVNISPEEIDQLLSGHPDLVEACSFGVPDDILGEKVAVAIVVRGDTTLGIKDLADFLDNAGVAKHKWPQYLITRDVLPRNAMNKIMRKEVREAAITQFVK